MKPKAWITAGSRHTMLIIYALPSCRIFELLEIKIATKSFAWHWYIQLLDVAYIMRYLCAYYFHCFGKVLLN